MFPTQSTLAAIVYDAGQPPDEQLLAFAAGLKSGGLKPVGLIQNGRNCHSAPAFSITLIHSGENLNVLFDHGRQAASCRLDVDRLLDAGMRVAAAMETGADVLIVNRFGKQEQEGKGLLFLIEKAVNLKLPVLIAVARERLSAWLAFSSGVGAVLEQDKSSLDRWWRSVSLH